MTPSGDAPMGFIFSICIAISGGNAIANGDIGPIPSGDAAPSGEPPPNEESGEPPPSGLEGIPPPIIDEGFAGNPPTDGIGGPGNLEPADSGVGSESTPGRFVLGDTAGEEGAGTTGVEAGSCARVSATAKIPRNAARKVARRI